MPVLTRHLIIFIDLYRGAARIVQYLALIALSTIREKLDTCDKCPNDKYSKVIHEDNCATAHCKPVQLTGHSLLCYNGSECKSELRILRTASTHYAVLRSFLRAVYSALSSHKAVAHIDKALSDSNFNQLLQISNVACDSLFSNEVLSTHQQVAGDIADNFLRKPGLQMQLETDHAKIIAEFEKAVHDYATYVCCSCQRLLKRSAVTVVKFSDNLGPVWPALKDFLLKEDSQAASKMHYMCKYCKEFFTKKGKMPPRCALNGLQVVPIPPELSKLDCLSRQFIQRAKAYQTIIRLGTYSQKVPTYNSLKACKGNVFFLPLPLDKTLETLNKVGLDSLADPELYIIVNGQPTKNKVV